MTSFSSDRPSSDPKEDLFGHAPFAKNLAESICHYPGSDGLVISLYGPWGSGKSTVLSYVRHYIEQKPEAEQPVIVIFNPWWFSGQENLARAFLGQLQAVLPEKHAGFKKLGDKLFEFSEGIGALVELAGAPAILGRAIGHGIRLVKRKPQDVPALKTAVAELLLQERKRVLVIIDDIDRLAPEEVRQLFTVIKALADFPYLVYLLAFDREVATQAIEQQSGMPGDRYLEKIIQVPFELPVVDRIALRKALFNRLDAVLIGTPEGLFDGHYWGNVFHEGIDPLIQVPRDIVRLTNTLSITYPAVVGEVNPVDFIAVEAIRVFLPKAYQTIRSNAEKFSGYRSAGHEPERVHERSFHDGWLKEVPESLRPSTQDLAMRLFPRLESVWSNMHYGPDSERQWRKELRICSADVFPTYFRLALPEGAVSSQELKAVIALGDKPDELAATFVRATTQKRLDGLSKARALLEHVLDYVETDIPMEHINNWIGVLLDIGDDLIIDGDSPPGTFDFGNESRVCRVVYHLLKRVAEPSRSSMLLSAIENGKGLRVQEFLLASFQDKVEKPKAEGSQSLIDEATVTDLKKCWVEKVKAASVAGEFIARPSLAGLLAAWRHWGNPDEARSWAQIATSSDDELARLVTAFLSRTSSQSVGDQVARIKLRLNPKWLEPYLDVAACATRLRSLSDGGGLQGSMKEAVDQFLLEHKMLEEGKNPDAPFAFDD